MATGTVVRFFRGMLLAGLAMVAAQAQAAQINPKASFVIEKKQQVTVPAGVTPYALGAPVTVVLELAGAPVAAVQAASAVALGKAEKEQIARRIAASQEKVVAEVIARGGTVRATFQHAINGVKVAIPAAQLHSLRTIAGVVAVRSVQTFQPDQVADPDNAVGVPFIGATAAWGGVSGFHGERVKVAIIDTGIDYTHANFSGPGTVAAYEAAFAGAAAPADPALFGPGAPKVKGGIDLVGDHYGTAGDYTPKPDPNPLDCGGHGSHVSGTVAGFGVTASGSTYTGPYTSTTVAANAWTIGPGVAPKADLYAVKVFGCEGSTDVVVDAIDWAVKHDMDVINMSLGSAFGNPESADAIAAENAARAGVIVVASAGNSGPGSYLTGAPSVGDRVISVAASDVSLATIPTATIGVGTASITAQVSNGAPVTSATLDVVVLPLTGTFSGCTAAEFAAANVVGKLVVTVRGSCARVDRAILGQAAGAAAVVLINNGTGYGIYEYEIPGLTIPFLGVTPADGATLKAATSVTLAAGPSIPNPAYKRLASYSSGGARRGDSKLKPSITAPGSMVSSTAVGTGNQGVRFSGTSMASPHVAGVAALTVQAHPRWKHDDLRAAILATALPGEVPNYQARLAGVGSVRADRATATQAVILAQASGTMNLSFGFAELPDHDFQGADEFKVKNNGKTAAVFDVVTAPTSAIPHAVSVQPSRITVAPGESTSVRVTLQVPAATAGDTSRFRDVAGLVRLVPVTPDSNGGIALRVPYYLVTRARSEVEAEAVRPFGASTPVAAIELKNQGVIPGSADFYAWGPSGVRDPAIGEVNLRAAGAQSLAVSATDRLIVFAVNTWQKFNTAAAIEFDVAIDSNHDGWVDYVLFSYDYGRMTTGVFSGTVGVFLYSYLDGNTYDTGFNGTWLAPTDGSTALLPVPASWIDVTTENPRFDYFVQSYSWEGPSDSTVDVGSFNPFTSAIETGGWEVLTPGSKTTVPVGIDAAEWTLTPPRGLMIVNIDDHSGKEQAELIPARAP
jgi:minor extracellular serine protease Vpr